ncbi:ATP-dependent DNA helicase RecG [Eubacterium sp. AB3007]|uniref:ATP-dependent DNA helicase RecG n=1 Tax=Eubacterium sp. AB3007 TaxID=1392487 RepID=UPI000487A893|nr:ATP-dependent DNA helicase RecG [Eubacterium sp. AB3007]
MYLTDPVTILKGVGPKKAEALRQHGIETLEDLAQFFPKDYEDRRKITPLTQVRPGRAFLVKGTVVSRRYSGNPYHRKTPLSLLLQDESGMIEIVYFNGRYLAGAFQIDQEFLFYGNVTENRGRLQMIHPESCREGSEEDVRGVLPVYSAIKGISQKEMRRFQRSAAELTARIPEWLPEHIVQSYRLASPAYALSNIHFPEDRHHLLVSRFRLIFDELLTLQTGLLYMKQGIREDHSGVRIEVGKAEDFLRRLPFSLTEGQRRVWGEIASDLSSEQAMNRLVQGDVGSGKTVIAEIAMYCAACSGYQSAMMAPTEILAKQHYKNLQKAFEGFDLSVDLLCGSMAASEKQEVLGRLADGSTDILVGTHAVIQPGVTFSGLGLVVTDEQHRFGVEQRHRLSGKGENPNVMVMTATPIPRTLAVILYGELDISVIDTMPAGRKPIRTLAFNMKEMKRVLKGMTQEIEKGHQVYVVAPLIEESEAMDALSAEEIYEKMCKHFPNRRVALIHGRLPQQEKDALMESFHDGNIDILVATVVIEIGIDVANATMMVIMNCERFGLAQMHQLRGRVGRGDAQSYCCLVMGNESEVASKRMEIMVHSGDGFRIAEEDLRLRGPGEIFGTRQHGLPEMHIGDIVRHGDVLEKAKQAAADILSEDAALQGADFAELRRRVERMFGEDIKLEL